MFEMPDWVLEQAELLSVVGSTAHGTSASQEGPLGDDLDLAGFFVPVKETALGVDDAGSRIYRSKPEGIRSEAGDVDCVLHPARKFVKLLEKGNPSVLAIVWSADKRQVTNVGEMVLEMRSHFVSKAAGRAFMGYAESQYLKLMGQRGQKNVNRPELVAAHGYDTKYASHVLRLCYQGQVFMQEHYMPMPVEGEARERILRVRSGGATLGEAIELIAEARERLSLAVEQADMQDMPSRRVTNELLVRMHEEAWSPAVFRWVVTK